jgi:hypothetical protein
MITQDTTNKGGRIARLRASKDTGLDRLWSWAQKRGIYSSGDMLERLEEKWETLCRNPSAEKPRKILDLHFGITGSPHTLREVARMIGMPVGSVSGKLYAAAGLLCRTKVEPAIPFIAADTEEFVTFPQMFSPKVAESRRPNPTAQWYALPKWQRERIYRALLTLQEEAHAAVQEHNRMRLPELSEDSRQIEATAEIALRVLGFNVGEP